MSKIINTDEIVSLTPFAIKDLHVFIRGQNKLSIAQTIPVAAGDRFVLLSHNDFTSTNGQLIKCSVDDTKHARGWLECFLGYPVYHGTPNHECQFVVVEKTLGQNYFTVIRFGVFIAGNEMRVLEQKSAVPGAAAPASKHDAKKPSRPLRKSLNMSGDQPAAAAASAAPSRLSLRIKPGSMIEPAPIIHQDQPLNASGELSADSIVNKALDKLTETAIAELKEYKRTSKLAIDQNLEKYRADETARVHAELAEKQERVAALRSQEIELTAQLRVQEGKLKRNREEEKAKAIMGYSEDEIARRTRARFVPIEEL